MENHFYYIRWPPLDVTIFIMHMRNCIMGARSMPMEALQLVFYQENNNFVVRMHFGKAESCIPILDLWPWNWPKISKTFLFLLFLKLNFNL